MLDTILAIRFCLFSFPVFLVVGREKLFAFNLKSSIKLFDWRFRQWLPEGKYVHFMLECTITTATATNDSSYLFLLSTVVAATFYYRTHAEQQHQQKIRYTICVMIILDVRCTEYANTAISHHTQKSSLSNVCTTTAVSTNKSNAENRLKHLPTMLIHFTMSTRVLIQGRRRRCRPCCHCRCRRLCHYIHNNGRRTIVTATANSSRQIW